MTPPRIVIPTTVIFNLGAYLGPQEKSAAWVKPQVKAWFHGVRVLGKFSLRHPQSDYTGLGMLSQLKWQYLQGAVTRVGTLMGPIEEALREKLFRVIFRGEVINANFRKILGHIIKHG